MFRQTAEAMHWWKVQVSAHIFARRKEERKSRPRTKAAKDKKRMQKETQFETQKGPGKI